MQNRSTHATTVLSTLFLFSAPALAGPDWIEDGDAGSMVDGAQDTTSAGLLNTIAGSLGGDDQEDVYRLVIEDTDDIAAPVGIGFQQGPGLFNPALWLFDSEGFGVLGNDDDPFLGGPGARLITPSTDGVTLMLPPGEYFLAITESGNVPLSFFGDGRGSGAFEEIFFFKDPTEVSGPDGAGAGNPLAGWTGGAGTFSDYVLVITPAPASTSLVGIAALACTRRRRSI